MELTNKVTLGEFNTISFALPSDIQAKLGTSGYSDLQLKLVLNLPYNATGPYILDKLTSGQYEDPDGPVPEPDTPAEVAVAGFEEPLKWEGEGAELALDSENAALGESALAEGDDFEEPEAGPVLDSAGSLPSTFRQSPAVKFPGKPQGPG